MRIGHQLFEFLFDFTDTGSYCVDDTTTFSDANGRILCIREMYINDEERQVYLILEDETGNQSEHGCVHTERQEIHQESRIEDKEVTEGRTGPRVYIV